MRNVIPKIGLVYLLVFFAYSWTHSADSNPEEITLKSGLLFFPALLLTFSTMYIAGRRAHLSKRWGWLWAVILLWPLSYVYTLAINRGEAQP
jgi:uncharacterized membrane protein YhaH (DUF805 family)